MGSHVLEVSETIHDTGGLPCPPEVVHEGDSARTGVACWDPAAPPATPLPSPAPHHATPRCLFAQPDNIYEFGAQYFSALLQGPDGQDEGPSTSGLGLGNVATAAMAMDISKVTAGELEPMVLREWGLTPSTTSSMCALCGASWVLAQQ